MANDSKPPFSNYKSAALPAELCRRYPYKSRFQRVDQLVRPLHGSKPRANKPDDKLSHPVSALLAAYIGEITNYVELRVQLPIVDARVPL